MSAPSLEKVIASIEQLPGLDATTLQLLALLDSDDATNSKIVSTVECNQVLVMRVLRVANSPFYGMPNRIKNVEDALSLIGLLNLRMIVMANMLSTNSFPNLKGDNSLHRLFKHSLSVAVCASLVARNNRMDASQMFLAGVLHDVGVLVLLSCYPQVYQEIQDEMKKANLLAFEAEQKVLGFDHAAIGAALCRHWNLPSTIAHAIESHHAVEMFESEGKLLKEKDNFAAVIHIADGMARALNFEEDPDPLVAPLSDNAWYYFAGKQEELLKDFAQAHRLYLELVTGLT